MDLNSKNRSKKYERVMPRVLNRSSIKSSSVVTRHDTPSSVRLSAKPSVSIASASVYSELPTVLNDYIPESVREKPKRTVVVKPRKTLKSLDPALSPPRPPPRLVPRHQYLRKRPPNMRAETSAPSVLTRDPGKCSDSHVRQCYSSRSYSKLKELQEEIQMYHETEKLMKIRSRLYKNCGVVLDDVGMPAADKAIQVECADDVIDEEKANVKRSDEQRTQREDARAAVPNEQMRRGSPRYPVDRYLVQSSNKFEMVNIIDDELWNPEPALRPEDEIILRKLHEMLQTTADDLKVLSGEISKFHEPGIQFKTAPTPLDEEFNEKVHIEEVVNAKFHGYKIIEKPALNKPRNDSNETKVINQRPKVMNTGAQDKATTAKRPIRNLGISRTRIIQINENKESSNNEKFNNAKVYKAPTIAYNEFCFEHIEPEVKETSRKLQCQHMPRIDIRSELKEQKVLQLEIVPDSNVVNDINTAKSNVSVIVVQHENILQKDSAPPKQSTPYQNTQPNPTTYRRKVSKMSTCESSGSGNNISSDAQIKETIQKRIRSSIIRESPKSSARNQNKNTQSKKNDQKKRTGLNLEEWKKKLTKVYGSASSKKTKTSAHEVTSRKSSRKANNIPEALNNAEYIPYSALTLGGVKVSDVEREISDIPNKNNIPLSPILDKIISSRENSFRKPNPKNHRIHSPRILTTSDENLLQEVIDIEKSVSETLSKNLKKKANTPVIKPIPISSEESVNGKESENYADDFEEDKTEISNKSKEPKQNLSTDNDGSPKSDNTVKSKDSDLDDDNYDYSESDKIAVEKPTPGPSNSNKTHTKLNLTFKESVDIFEFVHSIDVQDTATQSNTDNKITPKETQTSPRSDKPIIQPTIRNDLWSLDPRHEVEKMFEMEKDFIKKLIIDEYGDLLEKNLNKPSTSNEKMEPIQKNISAMQKNTQTSPARVKHVMTSPKRTKSRMTSPFHQSVPVHQQTSPMVPVTDDPLNIDLTREADDISVNLSSPRFSLRLPQNSREVILNLEPRSRESAKSIEKNKPNRTFKITTASSSSIDADNSSSELSSLGEIKMRKFRKRVPSISECSSSSKYSSDLQSMGILPLRSEGELSMGQIAKIRVKKIQNSEGETSLE